jgi:serine/threonine-protein kinase
MVGQQIGHYKVVRKLGEGGMGAVFEAVHEHIGKRAAIKVLHRQFSQDPEFARRFFNEAKAVNLVQHNGLVNIFELGQLPDGSAYIVMDYLDGETLSGRIKRSGGRLGLEGLQLIRQIASALSAAHAKGIVHRDLKPANIIIVPEPEAPGGERAKILDFGVAKLTEEGEHTRTGVFMGTPKYMAPEQCRGAGHVDAKADVYSLGCMLYQGEIMAMHIFAQPQKLRDLDPSVPEGLAALTHRMLAKQPEERPTMAEVAMELGRYGALTGALPAITLSGGVPMLSAPSGALPVPVAADAPSAPSISIEPSSTIHKAAGETSQRGQLRGRGRLLLLIGAPALAVAVTAAIMLLQPARPAKVDPPPGPPELPLARPVPARVHWRISSQPAGAQVVRAADQTVLGTTPLKLEQARGEGTLALVLRLDGYEDLPLQVDRSANVDRSEVLKKKEPPSVTAQPTSGKAAKAGKGKRRGGKGKTNREDLNDDDDIPLVK